VDQALDCQYGFRSLICETSGAGGGNRTHGPPSLYVSYSFYVTPVTLETPKAPYLVTWRLRGEGRGLPGTLSLESKKSLHTQGSVTLNAASGSALGGAIESAIQNARTPVAPASQAAEKFIKAAVAAKEKHAPAERHHKRLEGFFVDLEDSGTTWTRPSKAISQEEALNLLRDAANNYDAQRERFSNPAKFEDGDLAKELGAWTDKPALPTPTWPD
jgi:hypothetical protein